MAKKISIFWFRQDLRITDNPGLYHAAKQGKVMPIYILDTANESKFALGGASRWWLHHSLQALNKTLDNKLNVYIGKPQQVLNKILQTNAINAVYWNRCYEPCRIRDDAIIKADLHEQNIECKSFNSALLWEPWENLKSDGTPYLVFTPFYSNGCLKKIPPRVPLPAPEQLSLVKDLANTSLIASLKLQPKTKWYSVMENSWEIGELAAQKKLNQFLANDLPGYKEQRNYPAQKNVSRLSPHLHFGEISPHQVWHGTKNYNFPPQYSNDLENFLRELGWREFSYSLLYHFPHLPEKNFKIKFDKFPWQENSTFLTAWQQGKTGYPFIDAGMRELWQTGYMHGRVRMAVGSFLVKNLRLHWRHGADWFWNCLLDADLANNSASWQWVAGSGADAAPYFRIFNPVTQGEKFDALGEYTKEFVPELAKLPYKYLFQPWTAPESVLNAAGVVLGKTYPKPIVDLKTSREQALQAYHALKANP